MESQYNKLRELSKKVGGFYEKIYVPVLQALPWLDADGNSLKTATEKVISNVAFPAYEFSSYKNQKESQQIIDRLQSRCNELESIFKEMQVDLRPILDELPPQNRTWKEVQAMIPKWKDLSSTDALPLRVHKAIEGSFHRSLGTETEKPLLGQTVTQDTVCRNTESIVDSHEAVLGKLIAHKVRHMHERGRSDHDIVVNFGTHGFWLDRGFLNTLRKAHRYKDQKGYGKGF